METPDKAGPLKLTVCQRLAQDWARLADYVEITPAERAAFPPGRGPESVWEWLELRGRLAELPDALAAIDRDDLAALVREPLQRPQPAAAVYTS